MSTSSGAGGSSSSRLPRERIQNVGFPLTMTASTSRRQPPTSLIYRTSPGPDQRLPDTPSPTDTIQSAAAIFRISEADVRTAQPGNYRLGEQGVIASGRVIPVSSIVQPSGANNQGTVIHTASQHPYSTHGNPVPVKRVIKRRERGPVEIRSNIATARLLKEAQQISKTAPSGCYAAPKSDDLYEWAAVIEGPSDTVYSGGTFFCNISMKDSYPFHPPKILFLTRIYHCNINAKGDVCVDILRDKWKSTMTVSTVLQSLLSLMYQCNPDDALVTSIGTQYKEDREQFEKTARIWTTRYAT